MQTAVLTDHEHAALQAYLRLLQTVRAAFDSQPDGRRPPAVPPSALAEAERALATAGLAGNEKSFFRMLHRWCPEPGSRLT